MIQLRIKQSKTDSLALTRQIFATALDSLLTEPQLDPGEFNTHSFQVGAATSAKEANISDMHIKMLGRWKSDAYQCYIRTSPSKVAQLSNELVAGLP